MRKPLSKRYYFEMMSFIKPLKSLSLLALTVMCGYTGAEPSKDEKVINIGNRREIFVDSYLLDTLKGVQLTAHVPRDEGSVLQFDKNWESSTPAYITILHDGAGDIYRLYYRGGHERDNGKRQENTCYAESKDGIHWERPSLGIVDVKGSKANNVILEEVPFTHNFSPFIDKKPGVPAEQRFKAFAGTDRTGLFPYVSADGIHWKKITDKPVITDGLLDSQNVAFWSESEQVYVCYFRSWTGGGEGGYRSISRATSKDFINWSKGVEMTYGNAPFEHLYTQQTSPYFRAPHVYIAIGSRFVPHRQILSTEQLERLKVDPSQHKGLSEPFLMSSRGGNTYDRTFMEAFIPPAMGQNHWSARTNYPSLNVVPTEEGRMSLYVNQDYAQPTGHLRRYSMRVDGFSSLKGTYQGGYVVTKPIIFKGQELEINFSTSAVGEIRIGLEDEHGKVISGYSMVDCQQIIGNELSRIVNWGDNSDLSKLAGKPIRLRVYLADAHLYSIRFK